MTQNELIDRLETFGIKCVIHVNGSRKAIYVDSVRPGSKAFYKGVVAGDLIHGLVQKDDHTFMLDIIRDLTPYRIIFNGVTLKPKLDTTWQKATGAADQARLNTGLQKQPEPREKVLLKYDIELLIDTSGSMKEVDGTDGISKFDWCHQQVYDLAERLRPYQRSLTITTFNSQSSTEEGCSADQVERVFANIIPNGGTNLLDPLQAALQRSDARTHASGRRAMIGVITDGMPTIPTDPAEINRMIVRFTRHLEDPDQILLVFFQVGSSFNGRDFCLALDNNLVSEGAKFDIVDTQTFDELKQSGLTNALINSIVEEKLARLHHHEQKPLTDLSSDEEVQRLRKERAQIEKELMNN